MRDTEQMRVELLSAGARRLLGHLARQGNRPAAPKRAASTISDRPRSQCMAAAQREAQARAAATREATSRAAGAADQERRHAEAAAVWDRIRGRCTGAES